MSPHFDMFAQGAAVLAENFEYSPVHERNGISRAEWELFTQEDAWSTAQRQRIRGIMSEVLQASMTIAGLPSSPVPGHYACAIIACIVRPRNRLVACHSCPTTYDPSLASGLQGPPEIKEMTREQIIGIMLAYVGSARFDGPSGMEIDLPENAKPAKETRRKA